MSFTFPSRLLGELLVERGLIVSADLEDALVEQRSTGRRLGEVLVSRGALTGAQLTRALAKQYGIELPTVTVSTLEIPEPPAPWQPLGRLLVARSVISQAALDEALATQRRSGRKLGDVLVSEHGVSMLELAAALSEQHGLAVGANAAARPVASGFPDESFYEVKEPGVAALFSTDSFLEATDFAFEYLAAESPDVLEIIRQRGADRERVWQCDQNGEPLAGKADDPIATYGFDPNAWIGPSFDH
jgi:adenylate cyclase